MKRKGAKRGHSRSKNESVYVTIRYHSVNKKKHDTQITTTIPEMTFEEVSSRITPIVQDLKTEGETRLEKMA
jgi:hypothetical protein